MALDDGLIVDLPLKTDGLDISGSGLDLTTISNPVFDGEFLQFDGINDYAARDLETAHKTADISITTVVNPASLPSNTYIAALMPRGSLKAGDGRGVIIANFSGKIFALIGRGGAPGFAFAESTTTLSIDADSVVGLTFNDASKTVKVFVNGVLEDTVGTTNSIEWNDIAGRDPDPASFFIGAGKNDGTTGNRVADSNFIDGGVARYRQWNRTISDAEVLEDYNLFINPPPTPIPPTPADTPSFFRIFKHLLPRAKAWRLSGTKQLTQFFEGLTGIGDDLKQFFDEVWLDIFPDTTRELEKWEAQFGLPDVSLTEQERRDRLTSSWQALGGQDPTYIQETLQAAGFPVYLHEWWEKPVGNPPVAINPLTYLNDGLTPTQYIANCGAQKANCGHSEAICGASISPTGFALVNKFFVALFGTVCGAQASNCGNSEAVCGARTSEYELKKYKIPTDPDTWPYFLYIGGQTFPNHATIPASRRNEFETLCLKLCPTQQWLGMLIDYA